MPYNVVKDDDSYFQVIPSTRKILVPESGRVLGTVGEHNSEHVTFQCPREIEGYDVSNCKQPYITYRNAEGKTHKMLILPQYITSDDEYVYITWVIDAGVTAKAGKIAFTLCFLDFSDAGSLAFLWNTTTCTDCEILDVMTNDNPLDITLPDSPHGLSAYEIALLNGYIGTELDWLASLVGEKGETGLTCEFRVNDTHIQWRYVGEAEWKNLIALESLKGKQGIQGIQGESGVTVPVDGFFTMSVDSEGNLWVHTADDSTDAPFEYDEETGNLYYITDEV